MNYKRDWKSNKGSKLNESKLDYYNLSDGNVTPNASDIMFEHRIKRIIEYEFRNVEKDTRKNTWHQWIES